MGSHGPGPDFYEPVPGWHIWRWSAKRHLGGRGVPGTDVPRASPPGDDQRAPDFVEPIVGWRVWRVMKCRDHYLLGSLFNNVAWFPATPLHAQCFQRIRSSLHRSPGEKCHCGIYAARPEAIEWASVAQRGLKPLVVGRVYLWGEVIEAERGWRAARAYPERIFVPRIREPFEDADFRIVDGLAAFGVPVEKVHVESKSALLPTLGILAANADARAATARAV
jgi:hypothetical protein